MTSSPATLRPVASRRGFTLIELMAVMTIVALGLLLLPANIDGFGTRAKLVSSASMMASVLTAAREMAILDGHEVRLQYDLAGTDRDREKTGHFRYIVASKKRERSKALDDPNGPSRDRDDREPEEEWITLDWRPFPNGVILTGYSQEAGSWIRSNPGGQPIEVSFAPDGTVRPAHAVRLTNIDLDADADRVMTIKINPLTSAPDINEGEVELPKWRTPDEFR